MLMVIVPVSHPPVYATDIYVKTAPLSCLSFIYPKQPTVRTELFSWIVEKLKLQQVTRRIYVSKQHYCPVLAYMSKATFCPD
jgi:hypothetical protein